jgi:formyl-CoA transferase
VFELEQIKARQSIETITFPDGRKMESVAPAPRLSATPGTIRSPYPSQIGEHTREVLLRAGLTEAEIAKLDADGVIGMHKSA